MYEPSKEYLLAVEKCKQREFVGNQNNVTANSTPVGSYTTNYPATKEGNRDGYTKQQYQDAKRSWKLYLNTGGGGIDNFKHYLRQSIIEDCPVTNTDINCAQRIFVRDVGNLKGRTTRATPKRIQDETIDIPRELIHQKMTSPCFSIYFTSIIF